MFYLVGPHIECQDGLTCGSDNCPDSLGFNDEVDCCYSQNQRIQTNSDYRKIKNPRKNSISKHPTHNKERISGLRPQQFGRERKMSPNPDFRKHSKVTNVDAMNVNNPKRILSRNKMDAIINRYIEFSDIPQFHNHLSLEHPRHSTKEDRVLRLKSQHFARENEMLPNSDFRNDPKYPSAISNHPKYFDLEEEMLLKPQFRKKVKKRSKQKRNTTQNKAKIGKTKSSQNYRDQSYCDGKKTTYENTSIVCNHLASSVYGLRVKLNPNVEILDFSKWKKNSSMIDDLKKRYRYSYRTDAVKNNFIGFKYLVHSPYDFPFVEEVGKAMGPSIQSYIGFLGFHSWITDDADAWKPSQKKCASKRDIELDVFNDYTRANCVFECQAKSIFENCRCLPYYYPEFHLVWENVNSTACNYDQLKCLSRVKGI